MEHFSWRVDRQVKSRSGQRRAEPGFIRHRSQRRESGCCQRCCQRPISGSKPRRPRRI